MTKRDLLHALASFEDDQYVFVLLHNETYPDGSQVFIQGVRVVAPWHMGRPDLIGLVADARNRDLRQPS